MVSKPRRKGIVNTVSVEGLEMPDLRPYFKHLNWRPMSHSCGVEVASDFADYPPDHLLFGLHKKCGFWTQAEAAILYNSAKQIKGNALDIGGHTGWTGAHLALAGCEVTAIDPMYSVPAFWQRTSDNITACEVAINLFPGTSRQFGAQTESRFELVVIDGDHSPPCPLEDAKLAQGVGAKLVLFHDAIGEPTQEGVRYLIAQGFSHRVYWTPHVIAVCWQGDFSPPAHVPLPNVHASVSQHYRI